MPAGETMPSAERAALDIVLRLRAAGHRALWAGGCVRDRLMGRVPKDVDIATSATPEEVMRLFPRAVAVGIAFGVVRLPIAPGVDIEIATFRRDVGSGDGRHPVRVDFADEHEDARRRDFTINGMFFDPVEQRVIDTVGGREDLARKVVRAIGDPRQRLEEDYLRMLRAVRFSATLEFDLDSALAEAITERARRLDRISAERIRDELTRLWCETPRAGQALRLLERVGLLAVALPEIAAMAGVEQPPEFHPEGDVLTHTVLMMDAMEHPPADLAWAVLLHDVGKPPTASVGPGRDGRPRIRFDRHDAVGAEMADAILRRLRFSNRSRERIVAVVANHMRMAEAPRMRRATLRRLVGSETFTLDRALHRLDCMASHGSLDVLEFLDRFAAELAAEPVLPERLIRGRDILALGIPAGPAVGQWLQRAYERQLESGETDREALLRWLADAIRIDPETRRSTTK